MKIARFAFLGTILSFLALPPWAGPALAQQTGPFRSDSGGWAPVKHLEFSPDDIEGGWLGPEGEQITSVPRTSHPSLIEIRTGFEAELVKTMEDL